MAVAHGLQGIVCVGQRLPLASVDDGEEVLIEEYHVGYVGMGVHGLDQGIILLLRWLQDDRAAIEQVVVIRTRLCNRCWLACGLVCRGEGAILGYPVTHMISAYTATEMCRNVTNQSLL